MFVIFNAFLILILKMFQKFSKNIYNVLNYNKIVTLSHPQTISDKIKVAW
jgi:hypothetical protein